MAHRQQESEFGIREGEIAIADPALRPPDAHLVFIGTVRSAWTSRADCPKNVDQARVRAVPATVEIDEPYRLGLNGIARSTHIVLLTWLDRGPRNLIVQKPRQAEKASGVFALRSPIRPNPVGLHIVRLIAVDETAGRLEVDAIDVLDGTPLIDIKPYFPRVDSYPEAATAPS